MSILDSKVYDNIIFLSTLPGLSWVPRIEDVSCGICHFTIPTKCSKVIRKSRETYPSHVPARSKSSQSNSTVASWKPTSKLQGKKKIAVPAATASGNIFFRLWPHGSYSVQHMGELAAELSAKDRAPCVISSTWVSQVEATRIQRASISIHRHHWCLRLRTAKLFLSNPIYN